MRSCDLAASPKLNTGINFYDIVVWKNNSEWGFTFKQFAQMCNNFMQFSNINAMFGKILVAKV